MSLKLTNTIFIEKAKQVHEDKYVYSLVEYINSSTKVKIVCKEHGDFEQRPNDHLNGRGCIKCGYLKTSKEGKMSVEDFSKKANKTHNNTYDYSNVIYKGSHEKVEIICNIHGVFFQNPGNHLNGQKCPNCALLDRNLYSCQKADKNKKEFKNKKATVYLINIYNNEENFYKIGVTTTSLKSRFGGLVKHYNYKQISRVETNLYDAIYLENKLLKLINKKYTPNHKIKGHTECFAFENSDQDILRKINV